MGLDLVSRFAQSTLSVGQVVTDLRLISGSTRLFPSPHHHHFFPHHYIYIHFFFFFCNRTDPTRGALLFRRGRQKEQLKTTGLVLQQIVNKYCCRTACRLFLHPGCRRNQRSFLLRVFPMVTYLSYLF